MRSFLRNGAPAVLGALLSLVPLRAAYAQTPGNDVVLAPPVLQTDAPAAYPDNAIAAKRFAIVTVTLTLEVSAEGKVTEAAVTSVAPEVDPSDGFAEAASRAAKGLVFAPATRNGAPISARIRYRYVFQPPPPILVGKLAMRDTNAPLAGVRVTVTAQNGVSKTEVTDAKGAFRFEGLPAGALRIEARPEGLEPIESTETLAYAEETSLVLRTTAVRAATTTPPGADEPEEVSVRGDKPPREVTKRTLTRAEMSLIPGNNGDAIRSVQSMPGVARPAPFDGRIIVRGADANDTQTFVEGIQVPNIFHFGGLSSVLPTETLDRLDFYPGNYSVTYGRGLGGIVDVALRDPKRDRFHGMAQLDLIDARLMVEGPIAKGWSFSASGRRSWFDVWLGPALRSFESGIQTLPKYYDYQLALQKNWSDDHFMRASFFGSDDSFRAVSANGKTDFGIAFWRALLTYRNRFSDKTEIRSTVSVGQDRNTTALGPFLGRYRATLVQGRAEVSHRLTSAVRANVGVDLLSVPYTMEIRVPVGFGFDTLNIVPGRTASSTTEDSTFRAGVYTEWELTPWKGARVVPGVRGDISTRAKDAQVSPRINLRQALSAGPFGTTLKAAAGLFYQPPAETETAQVFGQSGLTSKRAVQTDVGVEQSLGENVKLVVDAYYNHRDNLVVARQGNSGEGRAYGVETLIRFTGSDRFFGWLGYTLSRSDRRDSSTAEWRRFENDQTHVLTAVGSYNLGRGWRVGGRFRLASGNLYTPQREGGFNATTGDYYAAEGRTFGARLPAFHQLDLRVDKTWAFTSWKLTAYVDVQNIYNRQAPEAVTYNYNYTASDYVRGLTILPSLGLRGEF